MKTFVKKILTLLPESPIGQIITHRLEPFCPIFMLHRIASREEEFGQSISVIENNLRYVRKYNYNTISLFDLIKLLADGEPIPPKSVVFTIDDGFFDQIEYGGQLFAKYDIPLTCFVVTGFLDGVLWPWDNQVDYVVNAGKIPVKQLELPNGAILELPELRGEEKKDALVDVIRNNLKSIDNTCLYGWLPSLYEAFAVDRPQQPPAFHAPASWESLHRFVSSGHHVAPHGVSHRILSRLSDEDSRTEIVDSVKRVKEQLKDYSPVFAFPTGREVDFGAREMAYLNDIGIFGAVSVVYGSVTKNCELLNLSRYSMPSRHHDFIQYLSFIEFMKEQLRGYGQSSRIVQASVV